MIRLITCSNQSRELEYEKQRIDNEMLDLEEGKEWLTKERERFEVERKQHEEGLFKLKKQQAEVTTAWKQLESEKKAFQAKMDDIKAELETTQQKLKSEHNLVAEKEHKLVQVAVKV